ncbi:MAG: nuclear transport factor 2 family protein [Armatimonadetes bacterium]|nr:nuclear transport factor 2 family protein [Anaerolineae bacterium]
MSIETLLTCDAALVTATLNHDIEALDRLLAPSCVFLIPHGERLTKAQYLDDIRTGRWRPEIVQHEDVQVQLFTETAIITSQATFGWRGKAGRLLQSIELLTDIWVQTAGQWQLVTGTGAAPSALIGYRTQPENLYYQRELEAVTQAVLDYVEGLYLMQPERIQTSVHPELVKRGFMPHTTTPVPMTQSDLVEVASYPVAHPQHDITWKNITVYDIQDGIATARLRAWWGVDYLHLIKYEAGWQIVDVVWQAVPA